MSPCGEVSFGCILAVTFHRRYIQDERARQPPTSPRNKNPEHRPGIGLLSPPVFELHGDHMAGGVSISRRDGIKSMVERAGWSPIGDDRDAPNFRPLPAPQVGNDAHAVPACPSSDNLRLVRHFEKNGSSS
jgi:hypothetical protein